MKVLILAGGFGTRLSEETQNIPKPMVPIGNKPILWHIMKIYSSYGFNEFVILLGYKGYVIKEYFANYFLHQSDVAIDLKENNIEILNNTAEPWKVTMIDTGLHTMTGGRIKRVEELIGEESFMLTYGDGVSDVDIKSLLETHKNHGKAITMTAVQPEGRFGSLKFIGDQQISSFQEKPKGDGTWINGGFFVCEPKVFDYIKDGDKTIFERQPLEDLAKDGELFAYKHSGFWKPMDTLRDNKVLNSLWDKNEAKWKLWK
ncbi:glucose-1-phosphate cytidylyltransferase [bacterium]|jgi:glucose-1-phosphate cytidylyltransferase|nr:glucose-1-phosphate cytidylyltransferase [bacterium]